VSTHQRTPEKWANRIPEKFGHVMREDCQGQGLVVLQMEIDRL